jgi:hypothetical protein
MTDPTDLLEARALAGTATVAELDQLVTEYAARARAEGDLRAQKKLHKRACFFAGEAFAAGMADPDRLLVYSGVFERACAVHSFPAEHRSLQAKIVGKRLALLGLAAGVKVLAAARGRVSVEGAALGLGDPTLHSAGPEAWEDDLRAGRRALATTGSDGVYACELRLVEASEPVLEAKEYARLYSSTGAATIEVRSGRVVLGDAARADLGAGDKKPLAITVAPGLYRAIFFGFRRGSTEKVIVVLAAAAGRRDEPSGGVPSIFE